MLLFPGSENKLAYTWQISSFGSTEKGSANNTALPKVGNHNTIKHLHLHDTNQKHNMKDEFLLGRSDRISLFLLF